jgi:hypothetical protein
MGMFTRIIDTDGTEFQIKCGEDECETFHLGDTVTWEIHPDRPGKGKLLDDIYDGLDAWVLIKDHVVQAIVPRTDVAHALLIQEFGDIEPYDRAWWTETAWLQYDLKECQHALDDLAHELNQAQEEQAFLTSIIGLDDAAIASLRKEWYHKRLVTTMSGMLRTEMNYQGIARQVFKIEPLENDISKGAL